MRREAVITRAHASKMARRTRRLMRVAGAVATGVASIAMLGAAAAIVLLHVGLQPVLSGSMRPAFGPGALLVTRSIPTAHVRPGQVIVFRPPGEASAYAHRVQSVTGVAQHPVITTKGDANAAPDAWHAEVLGTHVPEVITSVPWLGRAFVAFHGQQFRLLIAAFAGIALAWTAAQRVRVGARIHRVPVTPIR